jgi:hypothetical protein
MNYDEEAYNELRRGLRINKNQLDEEAINQPNNYFHACEGYAFAVSVRDKKEHSLEVLTAELDREVRDVALRDRYKITDKATAQQITREPDYQLARKDWLDSCLMAARWDALRNSYRQRADMLRGLIQLHQTGYFGEVTGASERSDARQRFIERHRG